MESVLYDVYVQVDAPGHDSICYTYPMLSVKTPAALVDCTLAHNERTSALSLKNKRVSVAIMTGEHLRQFNLRFYTDDPDKAIANQAILREHLYKTFGTKKQHSDYYLSVWSNVPDSYGGGVLLEWGRTEPKGWRKNTYNKFKVPLNAYIGFGFEKEAIKNKAPAPPPRVRAVNKAVGYDPQLLIEHKPPQLLIEHHPAPIFIIDGGKPDKLTITTGTDCPVGGKMMAARKAEQAHQDILQRAITRQREANLESIRADAEAKQQADLKAQAIAMRNKAIQQLREQGAPV